MADRLAGMEVFVRTVEVGSISGAAASLGMSPQMASKHILSLELRLCARLLNRTTRSLSLTDVGRLYLEGCRRALAEADAADAVVAAQADRPRGLLKVTVPAAFGAARVTNSVTRFLAAYPEVRLELDLSDRLVDLVSEGYDAAIRIGDLPDSSLIGRALAPYYLIPCASPAYLALRGEPLHPDELRRHDCLEYKFAAYPVPLVWRFTGGGRGPVDVMPVARLITNSNRALVDAALDDFGITLAAEAVVAEYLAAGRLVRVLKSYEGPVRPMHLVFPANRTPSPKLRAFTEWVVNEFS